MSDTYQLPLLTPESQWIRPRELPDLRGRNLVALDTEEKDNGLSTNTGPGWPQRAGHVLGVSWATEDGQIGYAPINHPDTENFDKSQVSRWLRDLVKSRTPLLFQNAPYDLGWLFSDLQVEIPAEYPLEDLLACAFILDENHYEYNLEAICQRLDMEGKDEALLQEAAACYLRPPNALKSWKLTSKQIKAGMWRLPGRFVGPYAEVDALRTLQAFVKLQPGLYEQKVDSAYRLEMDLVPTIRAMRSRGIRVNTETALRHLEGFRKKVADILKELRRRLPGRGEITMEHLRSSRWLDPIFHDERVEVPETDKGNSSYTRDWMKDHEHWLPNLVNRALRYDRFAETFMKEYILGFAHRGRIHAEIHQYKSDDGGTVSYRFSYSNPPLQQAPSADNDPELGTAFRECFEADGLWGANDYSQQEYRFTAHFAAVCRVRGGAEAAQKFVDDPTLDFHKMVGELTGLGRPRAKIQNFALLYGQGLASTAAKLKVSEEEAKEIRKQVEDNAPFGPALDEYVRARAQRKGFLRLVDGARVRFDEWEAGWISREEFSRGLSEKRPMTPCSLEEAKERRADPQHPWHGASLRRAGVRKALNRLIQGSSARQTKAAVRACAREGLIPVLQMHDELDHDEDSEAKIRRVAEIMRDVLPLRVPMIVDTGIGRNWAEAKAKDKPKVEQPKIPAGTRRGRAGHALNKKIEVD